MILGACFCSPKKGWAFFWKILVGLNSGPQTAFAMSLFSASIFSKFPASWTALEIFIGVVELKGRVYMSRFSTVHECLELRYCLIQQKHPQASKSKPQEILCVFLRNHPPQTFIFVQWIWQSACPGIDSTKVCR